MPVPDRLIFRAPFCRNCHVGVSMKMLVLGAGLQGCAAAHNLLQRDGVAHVTIADLHPNRLPAFLQPYLGKRLRAVPLDASDFEAVVALMKGHDAALCAL